MIFKTSLGGRVSFRTKEGCREPKCLLCIFILAFTVAGSCVIQDRGLISDPSISSCKSTVCYWGWFTTRPIPVIISCNYECIRRGRLMEKCGIFLHVCIYLHVYFLCIYLYSWECEIEFMGMWIEIQRVMQHRALPRFQNMGHVVTRNSSKCLLLPCLSVVLSPFSPV